MSLNMQLIQKLMWKSDISIWIELYMMQKWKKIIAFF
jgi:hypothetical protein